MNAWKHGDRSAETIARRREITALLRLVRRAFEEDQAALIEEAERLVGTCEALPSGAGSTCWVGARGRGL
ncbi:MAG: hypothetical protein IH830_13480 [Planctomycetes bacterium]|nr:hypothetical protein [Planctomycetota bacterium]